jgi:hypothetical protein
MADSRINIKAELISQALDTGSVQQATRLLQEELYTMPPAEALSLVRAVKHQERQGIGADLQLKHLEKPGADLTKVEISQRTYNQFGHPLDLNSEVGVIQNTLPIYDSQRDRQFHHNYNRHYNSRSPLEHILHGVLHHELRKN